MTQTTWSTINMFLKQLPYCTRHNIGTEIAVQGNLLLYNRRRRCCRHARAILLVIMIVHHDTQRLPNNAESYPKNDIPNNRLVEKALHPICEQNHWDLQQTRIS